MNCIIAERSPLPRDISAIICYIAGRAKSALLLCLFMKSLLPQICMDLQVLEVVVCLGLCSCPSSALTIFMTLQVCFLCGFIPVRTSSFFTGHQFYSYWMSVDLKSIVLCVAMEAVVRVYSSMYC